MLILEKVPFFFEYFLGFKAIGLEDTQNSVKLHRTIQIKWKFCNYNQLSSTVTAKSDKCRLTPFLTCLVHFFSEHLFKPHHSPLQFTNALQCNTLVGTGLIWIRIHTLRTATQRSGAAGTLNIFHNVGFAYNLYAVSTLTMYPYMYKDTL